MEQIILSHHEADPHARRTGQPGDEGVLVTHISQGNTRIQMCQWVCGNRTRWKAHSRFKSCIQILTLF